MKVRKSQDLIINETWLKKQIIINIYKIMITSKIMKLMNYKHILTQKLQTVKLRWSDDKLSKILKGKIKLWNNWKEI